MIALENKLMFVYIQNNNTFIGEYCLKNKSWSNY